MSKLRLGPINEDKSVKMTIDLPGRVHRELMEYARVHARANNLADALPPERLVAPMIERFMATDREFGKLRRRAGT